MILGNASRDEQTQTAKQHWLINRPEQVNCWNICVHISNNANCVVVRLSLEHLIAWAICDTENSPARLHIHTHVLGSATTAATAPHCHCPNRKPLANNCSARSGSENETPGLCVAQAKPQHTESQAIATFAYLLRVMCVKCIDSYVKRVVIARTFLVVGIRAFRDGVEHVAQTPLYAVRWFWRTQAHTQPCLLYANMRRIRWFICAGGLTPSVCVPLAMHALFGLLCGVRARLSNGHDDCRGAHVHAQTCVRVCVICYVIASAASLYQHTIRIMIVGANVITHASLRLQCED